MSQQHELVAAAEALEPAAQTFATAYRRYVAAYEKVSRAARPDANAQRELDRAFGSAVPSLLIRRLRALGFQPVLDVARTPGTLTDTWVSEITAQMRALVP